MKPKSARTEPRPRQHRTRPTILLVDDDIVIRQLIKLLLKFRFGAKVVQATSNEQAYRAAKRRAFDLVISDYGRAGGDGLTFLREFKALYPKIPVVIHSGQAAAVRQRARRLGASACLQKPTPPTSMNRIIARVLSSA
jgi:CheY-like chemotaxis protein